MVWIVRVYGTGEVVRGFPLLLLSSSPFVSKGTISPDELLIAPAHRGAGSAIPTFRSSCETHVVNICGCKKHVVSICSW